MAFIRKIINIIRTPKNEFKTKGHELIIEHIPLIFNNVKNGEYIIEIGSDRNAGSTFHIAKLADKYDLNFITVDPDLNATSRADMILKKINKKFEAVNDYGENFLREFKHTLRLVYLDAFDIPGSWHSNEVIKSYSDRNQMMTIENCHKMHYECAVSISEKMPVGGFVCFDDVNPVDDQANLVFNKVSRDYKKWSGKGATAIPWLIENGFDVIDNKRACALLMRTI